MPYKYKKDQQAHSKKYALENKEKIAAYKIEYGEKNKDRIRARKKAHYELNKETINKKQRAFYEIHKDKLLGRNRDWLKTHPEKIKEYGKRRHQKVKLDVLNHYGHGNPHCKICGIKNVQYLCLDHINGDGNKHRKEISRGSAGYNMYRWIQKNNYPDGFQVLCFNHNFAKSHSDNWDELYNFYSEADKIEE